MIEHFNSHDENFLINKYSTCILVEPSGASGSNSAPISIFPEENIVVAGENFRLICIVAESKFLYSIFYYNLEFKILATHQMKIYLKS